MYPVTATHKFSASRLGMKKANLVTMLRMLIGAFVLVVAVGCQAPQESEGTIMRMAPCPDSPNCVSTYAQDELHSIDPIAYEGSAEDAKARLLTVIEEMPRTEIVEDDGDYLHVEFTSRIFRFVDDVEFLLDSEASVIHFRSASRMGQGDMGANRNRMESIREAFNAAQGS
jgi:uncharacterized protein (DUF1499 family)